MYLILTKRALYMMIICRCSSERRQVQGCCSQLLPRTCQNAVWGLLRRPFFETPGASGNFTIRQKTTFSVKNSIKPTL